MLYGFALLILLFGSCHVIFVLLGFQKMEALKKAYADIILNTAKESAARIMESERKALCFQQDLCSVKDEALSMLVRMKQMLDSKVLSASHVFVGVNCFFVL